MTFKTFELLCLAQQAFLWHNLVPSVVYHGRERQGLGHLKQVPVYCSIINKRVGACGTDQT